MHIVVMILLIWWTGEGNFGFLAALIVVATCIIISTVAAVDNTFIHPADKDYYKNSQEKKYVNFIFIKGTLSNGATFVCEYIENTENSNMSMLRIINSSTYSISQYDEMLDKIMENEKTQGSKINKAKVINELKWHKVAYNVGYKIESTASADVYLNHDDEDHGFFSWIMNSIYI